MNLNDAPEALERAAIQLTLAAIKMDDEADKEIIRRAVQLMVDFAAIADVTHRDFSWRGRFDHN